MTRSTEGHRFSLEADHPLYPFWFGPSWVFVEVFHGSYVMYFYIFVTCKRQEESGSAASPGLKDVV